MSPRFAAGVCAAALLLADGAPAQAGSGCAEQLREAVTRHYAALNRRDLSTLIQGYLPGAFLIDAHGGVRGADLRAIYERYLTELVPPPGVTRMRTLRCEGRVAHVVWRAEGPEGAEAPFGTDTFVFARDGRIRWQSRALFGGDEPNGDDGG